MTKVKKCNQTIENCISIIRSALIEIGDALTDTYGLVSNTKGDALLDKIYDAIHEYEGE